MVVGTVVVDSVVVDSVVVNGVVVDSVVVDSVVGGTEKCAKDHVDIWPSVKAKKSAFVQILGFEINPTLVSGIKNLLVFCLNLTAKLMQLIKGF